MESYKKWSLSAKLFKEDSTNQSKTKNNQTRKPSADECYKDKWRMPLDLWMLPMTLMENIICRLVPLKKKDNSVMPGVGECLRRIIGKTTTRLLKEDIIRAAETLQACAKLESCIEAAIHSVRKSFQNQNSECLLLIDTDNAFNQLNRKVSLENIKRLCLPIYTYLYNSYNTPAMLYLENGATYCHRRGWHKVTMQQWQCIHAISTQSVIQALSNETANDDVKQVWFADYSSAVRPLEGVSGTTYRPRDQTLDTVQNLQRSSS